MDVQGKLAVVTGGAHRLGGELSRALAADGARLLVHYHRSAVAAESLAREIGGEVVCADLTTPDGTRLLAERALRLSAETPLALWVNAAGTFRRVPFLQGDEALWRESVELGILAPAALLRRVTPVMEPGGLVVNILDVAAQTPWRGYAHHCSSKAALLMLTRCLAQELAPRVRVCAISPGVVLPPEDLAPRERQRLAALAPLSRLGQPADVVQALRYLVQADYVTGAVLPVDGGMGVRSPRW